MCTSDVLRPCLGLAWSAVVCSCWCIFPHRKWGAVCSVGRCEFSWHVFIARGRNSAIFSFHQARHVSRLCWVAQYVPMTPLPQLRRRLRISLCLRRHRFVVLLDTSLQSMPRSIILLEQLVHSLYLRFPRNFHIFAASDLAPHQACRVSIHAGRSHKPGSRTLSMTVRTFSRLSTRACMSSLS